MLESWQTPVLTAALNFLFDVGRDLISDIRKRRRQSISTQSQEPQEGQPSTAQPVAIGSTAPKVEFAYTGVISTREQALKSLVQETALKQRETELKHLIRLAETYRENYRLASEKYAKWGEALVPPIVAHELKDSEQHLIETLSKLKATIEAVLAKKIEIDEFSTVYNCYFY